VASPTKMAIGPGGKKVELPDNNFFGGNSNKPKDSIFTGSTNVFGNAGSGSLFGGNKPATQPESKEENDS
jgi:hypothetical protein